MLRKWMDRADCLPPNSLAYHGKWFTTAGDIAIPVRIANGPKIKNTLK
jgi:hypothetical protein